MQNNNNKANKLTHTAKMRAVIFFLQNEALGTTNNSAGCIMLQWNICMPIQLASGPLVCILHSLLLLYDLGECPKLPLFLLNCKVKIICYAPSRTA